MKEEVKKRADRQEGADARNVKNGYDSITLNFVY